MYPQDDEDTCVYSSLCSALYFLSFKKAADYLDVSKDKAMTLHNYTKWLSIANNELRVDPDPFFTERMALHKISKARKYDLITESNAHPDRLYHVVLSAADGSDNHAVAIVNKFTFDGNFANALRLSQESLDRACDSVFIGICSGYYWEPTDVLIAQRQKFGYRYCKR